MKTKKFPALDVLAVATMVDGLASGGSESCRRILCFMADAEELDAEDYEPVINLAHEQCVTSIFYQFPSFWEFNDLVQDIVDVGMDKRKTDKQIVKHILSAGKPMLDKILQETKGKVVVKQLHPYLTKHFVDPRITDYLAGKEAEKNRKFLDYLPGALIGIRLH